MNVRILNKCTMQCFVGFSQFLETCRMQKKLAEHGVAWISLPSDRDAFIETIDMDEKAATEPRSWTTYFGKSESDS